MVSGSTRFISTMHHHKEAKLLEQVTHSNKLQSFELHAIIIWARGTYLYKLTQK
jgi:hypothetical protein